MAWQNVSSCAIGDINGTHADVYLQYDDSSGNPRSCRLYVQCRQYHSVYIYFDNIAFNGNVVASRVLVNTSSTATPWSGSLSGGSYTTTFSCPWDSGTQSYSMSGSIPNANTAPTTPTVSVASNNTSNSLDITWGTSSFGTPSTGTAYIYSGTSASPTQMQYSKTTTGNSLWTNTGLTANTKYYYRARAKNTADLWSSYSADATGVVKAAPATVSLSSYDSASATISYSAPADGGYYDRYIQYSLDGTNWSNAVTITGGSADSGTFTVSGLNPSTAYTIRTRMTTTAGSLNGSSISVTTKAAVSLYGSVNGQTKKVAKLYGSIDTIHNAELKGDTYQFTTTGKNKIDYLTAVPATAQTTTTFVTDGFRSVTTSSGYATKITLSIKASTTYALSWNLSIEAQCSPLVRVYKGTTTSSGFYVSQNATSGAGSLSFTTDSDATDINIWFYNGSPAEGTTVWTYIQLEENATATSYEPYTAGASPNPSYPQQIDIVTGEQTVVVTGKNLFITDWEEGEVSSATGQNIASTAAVRTKDYIPVKPNQHYAINRSVTTSYTNVRCYDKNKGYIGVGGAGIDFISGQGGSTAGNPMVAAAYRCVISPKGGTYYLRFNDFSNDTSTHYMMTEGDTQAAYEPYQAQSYEVNLGKNLMPMAAAVMTDDTDRQRNFRIDLPIATYTVSFDLDSFERGSNNSFGIFMQLRYADNTQIDSEIISIGSSTTTGRKSFTFTTTKVVSSSTSLSTSNIRITATNWNNGARATISNIQIEAGTAATTYAPYFTPIELTKIGTYQDYIWKDGDTWKIHKETSKVVFDSTNVSKISQQPSNHQRYINAVANTIFVNLATGSPSYQSCCSHYSFVRNGTAWQGVGKCGFDPTGTFWFMDSTTDLTTMRQWFSSEGVYVYYPIATPTNTAITDATLIAQLEALEGSVAPSKTPTVTVMGTLPAIVAFDVDELSKKISKLYGSVNGGAKLIYEA